MNKLILHKMCIIQLYIFFYKDKEVNINPPISVEQYLLFETAYQIANDFFLKNNIRWTKIK